MCAFLGVSRAAYYAWVKRINQPDPDASRMALVQEAYDASHQTYGYRRVQIWIQQKRGISSYPEYNHENVAMIEYDLPLDLWGTLQHKGLIDENAPVPPQ